MAKLSEDDRKACMGKNYAPLAPDKPRRRSRLAWLWTRPTSKSKKTA